MHNVGVDDVISWCMIINIFIRELWLFGYLVDLKHTLPPKKIISSILEFWWGGGIKDFSYDATILNAPCSMSWSCKITFGPVKCPSLRIQDQMSCLTRNTVHFNGNDCFTPSYFFQNVSICQRRYDTENIYMCYFVYAVYPRHTKHLFLSGSRPQYIFLQKYSYPLQMVDPPFYVSARVWWDKTKKRSITKIFKVKKNCYWNQF